MEKKKLTQEMIDSGKTFDELGFGWEKFLPYSRCEECAMELASRIIIVDDDGVTYYNYNHEMIESFFKLKYFSNVDTDDWDTEDGMRALHDFMRKNPNPEINTLWNPGWSEVWSILTNLYDAMEAKHKRKSSLDYKLGKIFESVLTGGDLVNTLAKSREVSEKMIDMVKVFKDHEEKPKTNIDTMKMFAKK